MTPSSGYSEDELIEQPAIELFSKLGWETIFCFGEFDGGDSCLGRENRGEAILIDRLCATLEKLNPGVPLEAFGIAIEELTRDRSAMSLAQANREVYDLIKDGIRVTIPDPETGGETVETVKVIDWRDPENNDFLLASQFWITGEVYTRRMDLVGFVNGLPLLLMELKASHNRLESAYKDNLRDYKTSVPHLFWPNAIIILSNGSRSKVGSLTAEWDHFNEWKKINHEGEEGAISLETTIRAVSEKSRLLDLIENYTLFQEIRGGLVKLVGKNHQYLGVENAIKALHEAREGRGKLGVFWHTQGSGKSLSMVFFAQKVFRELRGNWTFVIVTDRLELDDQIYKTFASTGAISEARAQAENSEHLRQLLTEDHRYVFTLIQKFRAEKGQKHPVLSERDDIIVITDEAHRSQYDTLALNMRTALPNASFIAFTGTPLIAGEEERTREVFGDYVSIYNFRQSMDDGATVPLYYENRIPELQLTNENLKNELEELLEEAELDEGQEKKLEREFSREYHLITREPRLDKIAEDLVQHFVGRGFKGKGMVVSIDKATAVKMFDRVQKHWKIELEKTRLDLESGPDDPELAEKLKFMEETDMAVVVSQAQNEVEELKKKGADIVPHRKRMVQEDLETKFKDPDDPLRLVFVCAMWMTGFDVPSCSTIYLDKPMRNHTLMQTIARANRVFPEKENGLIVDYVGVFRDLQKALVVYGSGSGGGVTEGDLPVRDKKALVEHLSELLDEMETFCDEHGVDLDAIEQAEGFERVALLDDAVNALVGKEDRKRTFLSMTGRIGRVYKAVLPDEEANQFAGRCTLLAVIAKKIRSLDPESDIGEVMDQVEELLDRSVAAEAYVIRDSPRLVDLSQIDFDSLRQRFEKGERKNSIVESLKAKVQRKVRDLVRENRTRMDLAEKLQKMIEEYNTGSSNQDEFFRQLIQFARDLTDEEQRHVREHLTEEELVIFDLLTKPDMNLTPEEEDRVRKVSRQLLATLKKEKFVLDWRKHQAGRGGVRVTIEKLLDEGLPRKYEPELFEQKCTAIYNHVYDSYFGAGQSIYGVRNM